MQQNAIGFLCFHTMYRIHITNRHSLVMHKYCEFIFYISHIKVQLYHAHYNLQSHSKMELCTPDWKLLIRALVKATKSHIDFRKHLFEFVICSVPKQGTKEHVLRLHHVITQSLGLQDWPGTGSPRDCLVLDGQRASIAEVVSPSKSTLRSATQC